MAGSLIRMIISLMARFNSLFGRNKFPVPTRREFRHNSFKLLTNFEPLAGRRRPREQNSRYYVANATKTGASKARLGWFIIHAICWLINSASIGKASDRSMLQNDLACFKRFPMAWIDQTKFMPSDINGINYLNRKIESGRVDIVGGLMHEGPVALHAVLGRHQLR
jgi:hypothetical protein